ncbi:MAG TPA: hypothetical protein DCG49_05555 [Ruminococcus sp.]|nr:hypothetical protein [Ruminococcus sp.]
MCAAQYLKTRKTARKYYQKQDFRQIAAQRTQKSPKSSFSAKYTPYEQKTDLFSHKNPQLTAYEL